jgi:hypothetical protein
MKTDLEGTICDDVHLVRVVEGAAEVQELTNTVM